MVPLDDRRTVLDWMAALEMPLILVVGELSRHHQPHADRARRTRSAWAQGSGDRGQRKRRQRVSLDDTVASVAAVRAKTDILALPRLPRCDTREALSSA